MFLPSKIKTPNHFSMQAMLGDILLHQDLLQAYILLYMPKVWMLLQSEYVQLPSSSRKIKKDTIKAN